MHACMTVCMYSIFHINPNSDVASLYTPRWLIQYLCSFWYPSKMLCLMLHFRFFNHPCVVWNAYTPTFAFIELVEGRNVRYTGIPEVFDRQTKTLFPVDFHFLQSVYQLLLSYFNWIPTSNSISGWWFRTFFDVSIYLECHHPNWL